MNNVKVTKILLILLSIQLLINTSALCDDTLTIESEMIKSAIKILKNDGINTDNYKATALSISNSEYDANYVVSFEIKRLPGEPPPFGGGYSVYFKRKNNENKFIVVIREQ